jgi:hypothetical protein
MQLQNPTILYFLLLLLIPILVHLFQLRKFKTEYFTNVKFLKELSVQTRKSSKLKKYLLLFTRLFLLTFLIFAFAKPFIPAKDAKNANNELYIILDNSFSMQAKGKQGELMRRAVQDLLETAPDNATFSLLTCDENFWNTDIKSIQKELLNLKYSANNFNLASILNKIKTHKSAFSKDIVVVTDGVGVINIKQNSDAKNLYFIIPEAEKKENLAIDSVFILQTTDKFYELGVQLKGFGKEFKDVSLALYNQEKLVAKTLVSVGKENKTVKFSVSKQDFNGYATIVEDGLQYDNTYFFSISRPEKTKVVSIGTAEKSYFLSKIYTSDAFNYQNFELSNLNYNILEEQELIVVNELESIPQALQTTLKAFVQKGGNIVFIPNSAANISNSTRFLSNFGSMQFLELTSLQHNITNVSFNHPLFSGVFESKVSNFQYPMVKQSFGVKNAPPTILGLDNQLPFLSAFSSDLSSVYIFSAAINKENSNFQNSPLIVPTFYNMAKNNQKTGVKAISMPSEKSFIAEATIGKDEILNVENSSEKFIPIQQILNNKVKLTFGENPKKAGNFEIKNGKETIENLSFNYNRSESDLYAVNSNLASGSKEIESLNSLFDTIKVDRSTNQIWKIFLIFTLLFLLFEVLIQKFVK